MLAGAIIGIVPYPKTLQMEYALPVKILEYIMLGITVITSDLLTVRYYFDEESVYYYDSNNVQKLADAIINLYNDESKRKKLAYNSKSFFQQHNWQISKKTLYSIVDR